MQVCELAAGFSAETAVRRLSRRPGLAWLDAGGADANLADSRFSFVASDPIANWHSAPDAGAPFAALDELTTDAAGCDTHGRGFPAPLRAAQVPRYIGYIGYDAHFCGKRRRLQQASAKVLHFARYDACLVFDHADARAFIAGDDLAACERLRARLEAPERELAAQAGAVRIPDAQVHARAIERALEHIARGDVYQVNLARELRAAFRGEPLALAFAMREQSPVPFGFYFDETERAIVGRSMERFLRFDPSTRTLVTRPIKGTLARHGLDSQEALALANDPKERAEHAMIVDLMRNDLSRVAELGSVHVPEVMAVERYAKLSHLVSSVACRVRGDVTLRAMVEATFPPGSVTGAPKLRAMEVIEALESTARGVYTGAYGFVDRAGGLSLAVAIRTATVQDAEACYFSGGGIVEASDVARELAETELKARVFCDALRTLGAPEVRGLSGAPVLR